jgi:large subunit ribosomal protein L25
MASVQIDVEQRAVMGKKVKALRRQGMIPAHLYGHGIDSLALQAPATIVSTLLRTAERNQIIDLKIGGEPQTRSVMLRGVQRNPVTDDLLHIDFFQISLTEKLSANVPLNFIGEAPAVQVFSGILLHQIDHVSVEALPADLPGHIDVDVSTLDVLEASLFVRDLVLPPNVEMLSDPDQVVAKVAPPRVAEEVAPTPEAVAAAAAAAEGEEGAPAAAADASKEESSG